MGGNPWKSGGPLGVPGKLSTKPKIAVAQKAHVSPRVWHSETDGNFVGSLANRLGNVVEDIDVNFKFSGGAGDVDIMTSKYNIEVKSGGKMKLTQSLKNMEYAKSQDKGYILYMPNATSAQMKEASKKGITIYRTEETLKQALDNQ
jgi:hypothetical protein